MRAAVAAVIAVMAAAGVRAADAIPWQADLPRAARAAQAAHQLMLIDFKAGWCPTCVEEATSVFADRRVVEAATAFVPVRIDYDGDRPTAVRYAVAALPTTIVADAKGTELFRLQGATDAATLAAKLRSIAESRRAGARAPR
jgi:thiol:disulfide interchange protein